MRFPTILPTAATALVAVALTMDVSQAFVVTSTPRRGQATRLFLEDWLAELIDHELYRENHEKDFENEWMEKNRGAVFHHMESDFGPVDDIDQTDFRMHHKDEKLAFENPERYCADRCIATGNCDIYEDFYELSPHEVMHFCNDCVLSEGEDPCDIPDGFYDRLMP